MFFIPKGAFAINDSFYGTKSFRMWVGGYGRRFVLGEMLMPRFGTWYVRGTDWYAVAGRPVGLCTRYAQHEPI